MRYYEVFFAFVAMLPALYVFLFPHLETKKRFALNVIGILSFISIFILTQVLNDVSLITFLFAIIPFTIVAYYSHFIWLVITTVSISLYEIITMKDINEYLPLITYLLIVSVILIFSKSHFHMLKDKYKIIYLFGSSISCCLLIMLYTLQYSPQLFYDAMDENWKVKIIVSFIIFLLSLMLSYSLIEKQEKFLFYKKEQDKLRNSNNYLQAWSKAVHNAPFAVLTIKLNEELIYINKQALIMYECDPAALQSENTKLLNQIIPEPNYNKVALMLKQVLSKGGSQVLVIYHEQQAFLYSAIPIFNDQDDVIKLVSFFVQDVTEFEQYRRELDRMDRLNIVGEMAASITHEIRNPMAVIRGYIQLLQERSEDKQRGYYRIILEELDRTNLIISDFLTLAKNKHEQSYSTSLNKVIQNIVPLLQADANLRGQSIFLELSELIPSFNFLENEMKQLLLNISRNGMEAMESGGTLKISTEYVDGVILLKISDQGSGISDDLKEKIFDPFYTSKSNGTGLGLPLCASIVGRYQGWINVKDNQERGTVFEINFPLLHHQISS